MSPYGHPLRYRSYTHLVHILQTFCNQFIVFIVNDISTQILFKSASTALSSLQEGQELTECRIIYFTRYMEFAYKSVQKVNLHMFHMCETSDNSSYLYHR